MLINNAKTASEFAQAWERDGSPVAAARAIKGAMLSQAECARNAEQRGLVETAKGHWAAVNALHAFAS